MEFFGRLGKMTWSEKRKIGRGKNNTLHDPKGNGEVLHWSVHVCFCNSEPDDECGVKCVLTTNKAKDVQVAAPSGVLGVSGVACDVKACERGDLVRLAREESLTPLALSPTTTTMNDTASISRATSISRASKQGSTISRSQSLIKKNIAPHDLRPSDVLIERFVAWKAIVKQLVAYFEVTYFF
jgi:hypothetical protein